MTTPFGSGDAVIASCETMGMERLADAVSWGLLESFTVTVALLVPAGPVGVPLITPVPELIVSPAGRPVADHV